MKTHSAKLFKPGLKVLVLQGDVEEVEMNTHYAFENPVTFYDVSTKNSTLTYELEKEFKGKVVRITIEELRDKEK